VSVSSLRSLKSVREVSARRNAPPRRRRDTRARGSVTSSQASAPPREARARYTLPYTPHALDRDRDRDTRYAGRAAPRARGRAPVAGGAPPGPSARACPVLFSRPPRPRRLAPGGERNKSDDTITDITVYGFLEITTCYSIDLGRLISDFDSVKPYCTTGARAHNRRRVLCPAGGSCDDVTAM